MRFYVPLVPSLVVLRRRSRISQVVDLLLLLRDSNFIFNYIPEGVGDPFLVVRVEGLFDAKFEPAQLPFKVVPVNDN